MSERLRRAMVRVRWRGLNRRGPRLRGPRPQAVNDFTCDDAGTGMIQTVRPVPVLVSDCGLQLVANDFTVMIRTMHPVPARVSDCGLQLLAKLSWRQSYGGTLGSAGEIHAG